jgi:hypothetical protein
MSAHPPAFLSSRLSALDHIRHGFFGREGGVSQGIYASLNAGPGSRDDGAHVEENRARIARALGAAPERFLSLYQIHSARAVRVDAPWTGERPQADAMITTGRGLVMTALSADCAPILLADRQARVIGAAHAGWKGAVAGVAEAALKAMEEAGAQRERIVAAIGPCIRQASYEVGPDFRETVLAQDPTAEAFLRPGTGDRLHFDLPHYVSARLARAGVTDIDVLPFDTYSESTALFSHRRSVHLNDGDYGRNCAAIVLV